MRLRFWALCQHLYAFFVTRFDPHVRKLTREIRKEAARFGIKGVDPLTDIANGELRGVTMLKGHLAYRCFESVSKHFRTLNDPGMLANDDWVVLTARMQLRRHVEDGPRASGFLKGYLLAQIRHLGSCPACRAKILAGIREEVRIDVWVKDITKDGYPVPPQAPK